MAQEDLIAVFFAVLVHVKNCFAFLFNPSFNTVFQSAFRPSTMHLRPPPQRAPTCVEIKIGMRARNSNHSVRRLDAMDPTIRIWILVQI
jgi:hypothetical protein